MYTATLHTPSLHNCKQGTQGVLCSNQVIPIVDKRTRRMMRLQPRASIRSSFFHRFPCLFLIVLDFICYPQCGYREGVGKMLTCHSGLVSRTCKKCQVADAQKFLLIFYLPWQNISQIDNRSPHAQCPRSKIEESNTHPQRHLSK